jgi:hypothetical protein
LADNGAMTNQALVPAEIAARYEVHEWRNGLAILTAAHPEEWANLLEVLRDFVLLKSDVLKPGGSKGLISQRLDSHFTKLGWIEKAFDTHILVRGNEITVTGEEAEADRVATLFEELLTILQQGQALTTDSVGKTIDMMRDADADARAGVAGSVVASRQPCPSFIAGALPLHGKIGRPRPSSPFAASINDCCSAFIVSLPCAKEDRGHDCWTVWRDHSDLRPILLLEVLDLTSAVTTM